MTATDTLYVDVLARQDERTWRELEQAAQQSGERSGGAFGGGFRRNAAGKLIDEKGRFVKEGEEVGEAAGRAAGRRFGAMFSQGARDSSKQLLGVLAGISAAAGGAAVGLVKLAGEAEQAQVSFTTLLGSGEKAKAFLADLAQFAAHTPFELTGLQDSAKRLLAFGFEAKQIIPMMTAIGDAVGSLGGGKDVLDGITTALGQMQAKGKVSAEEMAQMAERGIPVWDMLAKKIGVSVPEAMKMAEQGAISSAQAIPAILQGMNDKFGGGMEAQSRTLLGMWSNTMDTLTQAGVAAGKAIVKALDLGGVLSGLNEVLGKLPATLKGLDLKAWAHDNSGAIAAVAGAVVGALVPALVAGAAAAIAFIAPLLPFAAAGASIALVLKSMGVSLGDVKAGFEQAGRVLAPVRDYLTDLARDVQTRLLPVFGMLADAARSGFETVSSIVQRVLLPVFETLAPHLRGVMQAAGSVVVDFVGAVRDAFGLVQRVVQTLLIPTFEKIWPVIGPILGGILDGATVILGALGETFRRVGAVLRGDWATAFGDMQKTYEGFGDRLAQAGENMAQKVIAAGKKLGTYIWEGLQGALDGLQTLLLDALAAALDKLKGNLPSYLQGIAGMLANSARGAADRNAQDAATHYNNAGNVYAKPYGPQLGGTANTNIPEESGKFGYAFISSLANTFRNDPRVASDCAVIAYAILDKLGVKVKGAQLQNANVGVLEKNAIASGFQKVGGNEIRPGDLIVWTSGNGKTYGAVSGKHAGVAAGFDSKGRLMVINNPGSKDTVVEPMYDRQNATVYRAPTSPFAQQAITQQPKTNTSATTPSISSVFAGGAAGPASPEDIRKRVEAQIKDILARVDLKLISTPIAIQQIAALRDEAEKTARSMEGKGAKGWQEYAASAQTAQGAIDGLKKGVGSAKDVLAALTTQYEYAGKSGLPAYVKGLEAYIAQQDKVVQSAKKGSEEQITAMGNVARARKLLEEAQKASALGLSQTDLNKYRAGAEEVIRLEKAMATSTDVEWKRRAQNRIDAYNAQGETAQKVLALLKGTAEQEGVLRQNRLAAERALADGQIALAKGKAQEVINQYDREMKAAGNDADARLAVEQRLAKDVLAARNTLARASAQEEVTRLERERNAAVNVQGLTLKQRQELWAQYSEKIAQVNRNLSGTIEENAASSTRALLDLQVAAGQTASQLADQQIAAANARFKDLQAVTDYSYRLKYGAGDEGLIRSLSAATGFSVAKVREDVEGALAEARRLSGETAVVIERVWVDALTHRREVAAAERQEAENTARADQQAYAETRQFILDTLSNRTDEGLLRLYDDAHAKRDTELMSAVTAELTRRASENTNTILALQSEGNKRLADDAITEANRLLGEGNWDEAVNVLTSALDGLYERAGDGEDAVDGINSVTAALNGLADARDRLTGDVRALADWQALVASGAQEPLEGPVDARGTRPTETVTPSDPRGTRDSDPMTPTAGRGELTAEQRQFQATVEAKEAVDAYRVSLTLKSDAELESAKATEFAAGHQQQYNLIVEETERRAKIAADSTKLITDAEGELASLVTGESLPAWETRARALEQQAVLDVDNADRLLQLADAIRGAGQAAQDNADRLNVTVGVFGIDTGIKALDLFKQAAMGVADVVQGVFKDLASGAGVSAQGVLKAFASMTLGIIRSVATSIIAIQAQIIATQLLNLVTGLATFNPAALAKAAAIALAAAAVAGIASGLEARLSQKAEAISSGASSSSSGTSTGTSNTSTNSNVTIPTSQVTVMATPEFVAVFGRHVDRFGEFVDSLTQKGMRVHVETTASGSSGNLAYDLATGGL